jgi:hypothetical protein
MSGCTGDAALTYISTEGVVMKILSTVLLCCCAAMVGCASLTSFQEARTVEKGTGRAHIAYNKYIETQDTADFEGGMLQVAGRYGITDKFDLGITYVIPGSIVVDGKYLFTSRTFPLALSSGIKVGYLEYELFDVTTRAIDAIIPLYISYYPLSWIALTMIPDAVARFPIGDDDAKPLYLVGGNVNLKIGGARYGLIGEYGYHLEPGADATHAFQTMGGAFYMPLTISEFLALFGVK